MCNIKLLEIQIIIHYILIGMMLSICFTFQLHPIFSMTLMNITFFKILFCIKFTCYKKMYRLIVEILEYYPWNGGGGGQYQ